MSNEIKGPSLKREIATLLFTSSLLPFILVILANFWSLETFIRSDNKEFILSNIYRVDDLVDNLYSTNSDSINMISKDPNAVTLIESPANASC